MADQAKGTAGSRRKRGNGEGSLYQRESDGKWVGALTLPDGRRRVVYGTTQREGRQKLKALVAKVESGIRVDAGRALTVGAFFEDWLTVTLPGRVAAGKLSESTLEGYTDQARRHILPVFGKVPLEKLTARQARAWLAAKGKETSARGKPYSGRSLAYMHAVLRAALSDAVAEELIHRNVATLVDAPKGQATAGTTLDDEEAAKVLAAIVDDRLRAFWLTFLCLGLRKGEVLGLRWQDIDLDAGTVRTRKQLQRRKGAPDSTTGERRSRLVLVELKTEASKATLRLPDLLRDALRAHRNAQRRELLALGVRQTDDEDFVFTTPIGTPVEPRNVNRMWETVCQKAGIRSVRPHDLRHTCGTFLLAEGVDLKVVQSVLRHSRMATTADVYAHVLERVKEGAADTTDKLFRRLGAL